MGMLLHNVSFYFQRQMSQYCCCCFSVWHSAIDDFSQVLNFEPCNAEVRLLRSRAYMQMKMWNEALEDVSVAIHMDPLNSQAFYYRGCILRK